MTTDASAEVLDVRGLKCPLPVLRLEKRLAELPLGVSLTVLATDPVARVDIPLYCRQHGHECAVGSADGALSFAIRKRAPAGAQNTGAGGSV